MGIKKYKKQIIFGFSLILFICALIGVVLFFVSNTKSVETSSIDNTTNNVLSVDTKPQPQTIPNVSKENTTFKISDTKKKVEFVNISVTNRLPGYNLYYCLVFDNNPKISNQDYLVFNDLILLLEENCSILFKYELNGNLSNGAYKITVSNIKTKKVESEKATEKELKEQKVNKKDTLTGTSPYFIKVNYTANVVTVYSKDKDGNYTVPFKAMVCSCGTYTPKSGTYKTTNKYVWRPLIDNVYGHYATRIVGQILFHSVPYTASSNDSLEYWEYDKLGQTASAGCVRLTVRDAKWIYNNCPSGTMVEFYSDSNPGPLGKPSAQKISSNEECRNWDPTDPNSNNPWHTYKDNEKVENNNNNSNNTNNTNNIITDSNNTIINNTPIIEQPIIDSPTINESNNNQPTTDNPTVNEPSNDQPTTDNPTVDEPNNDQPSTDSPTVNESTNDQLTTDNPTVDEPSNDQPTTDNPTVNEPNTNQPTIDNPTLDEPDNDESSIDNSLVNGIV